MRNRVQTNLPAHRGRGVSTDFRRQGVGCFVARGGKKENDVRDEPHHQRFGSEIIHKQFSVESPRPESKFMGQLREPALGKIRLSFPLGFVYVFSNTCVGCLPWCAEEVWIEG